MTERGRRILQAAVLLLALCCLALGILRGEIAVVLAKAARLCLECVGIG